MSFREYKISQIGITIDTREKILEEIIKYLKKTNQQKSKVNNKITQPLVVYTPNPEIVVYSQEDEDFQRIVNKAQIKLPDGWGICFAISKIFGRKINRIAGVDFMKILCQEADKQAFTIGLIGGRRGVALKALKCLQKNHKNLKGWAVDGPEVEVESGKLKIENEKGVNTPRGWSGGAKSCFAGQAGVSAQAMTAPRWRDTDGELKNVIDKIIKEKTDILFVGFGHPKQEYFIDLINYQLSIINYQFPIVLMAVGGAFDYISGNVPRAPKFMQSRGLEWLYRLAREPWRLRRQLKGVMFYYMIYKEAI